ncbi:protein FAM151B-like isoform X1 [Limulus polyphemus]|uniref:Protein FAM151B-like isoform X1 n=2 Tax=Limulus polyphemus TaxID=6850 RepID=A0ABM1S8M2_LIMPO|nr:protein FAM151B-like isoform X1 [Limulus polyphemus]
MQASLLEYFPETNGDGLNVSWAHAVNSKGRLAAALRSQVMVLEADISMSTNSRFPVPIMAHPPAATSDITLEEWLHEAIPHNKGLKLDFKTTEVVEPACRVLARVAEQIRGPLILNADILPGPNNPITPPVDAWTFLTLCRTRFPRSVISIGWTTCSEVVEVMPGGCIKLGLTREQIDKMISLVKEYSLMQPVMFPVWVAHLKYSVPEVQRLLFQVPSSSLMAWCHKGDPVTLEDLLMIRKAFHVSQVFYDLPDDFLQHFYSIT